jgi:hypothetical protein
MTYVCVPRSYPHLEGQWRALPDLSLSFGLRYDLDFHQPGKSDLWNPNFAGATRQIQLSLKVTFKQSLFFRAW